MRRKVRNINNWVRRGVSVALSVALLSQPAFGALSSYVLAAEETETANAVRVSDFAGLKAAVEQADQSAVIIITESFGMEEEIEIGLKDITLLAEGDCTLTRENEENALFKVGEWRSSSELSGSLTIGAPEGMGEGNSLTLDGGTVWSDGPAYSVLGRSIVPSADEGIGGSHPAPIIAADIATVTLYRGAILQNNCSEYSEEMKEQAGDFDTRGGAVFLWFSNLFIHGATLRNNQADKGGAVAAMGDCEVEMTDGEISGNYATKTGGGLCQSQDYSDTTITFRISGGTIKNNSAGSHGGGIYAQTSVGTGKLFLSGTTKVLGNRVEGITYHYVSHAGGVAADGISSGDVKISDSVMIVGNTGLDADTGELNNSNLHIYQPSYSDEYQYDLSKDAKIGVSIFKDILYSDLLVIYVGDKIKEYKSCFFSDDPEYYIGDFYNQYVTTNPRGLCLKKGTEPGAIKILAQPKAPDNYPEDRRLELKASGTGLSYQWYRYNEKKEQYTAVTGPSGDPGYTLPKGLSGDQFYYCKITDQNRNSVTTNLVYLSAPTTASEPDTQAPVGTIRIGEQTWDKLGDVDEIHFDSSFEEETQVTITASDDDSYVESVSYYLSGKALTQDEVKTIDRWTEGYPDTTTFTISGDKKCVVYVKIEDAFGNVSYLSTGGLVFDMAPSVSGVADGQVYDAPKQVKVTDGNLASVTVDGKEITLTDGAFTLEEADGWQTIVATDAKGHSVTLTVAVNAAVSEVIKKINAIGKVEDTDECRQKLTDAREAYDNLNVSQKELVSSEIKKILTEAEKQYDENYNGGENQKTVSEAEAKIDAIELPVTATDTCWQKICEAKDAVNELTGAQRDMIDEAKRDKLVKAEADYHKLKADLVIEKIQALSGEEKGSLTWQELVEDAKDALNKLTKEQQELVPAELKEALLEAEIYKKNKNAADKAEYRIDAISLPITDTDECKRQIAYAKDAYDSLTEAQKEMVDAKKLEKLKDAKDAYDKLVTDSVTEKIQAVCGEKPGSSEWEQKLADAREAYDGLNDEQKELIASDVKKILTDAEKLYDDEKNNKGNQAAAEEVEKKIDAIALLITYTEACRQQIEEAREAYEKLTGAQKDMVDGEKRNKLSEAQGTYDKFAVAQATEKVNEILEEEPGSGAWEEKLTEAREAYDKLSDGQKDLVLPETKEILTEAEKRYDDEINDRKNQTAAAGVESKIDAIKFPITNTDGCKRQIEEAREAYEKLTGTQKDMVDAEKLVSLTEAEAVFAKLAADTAAAEEVEKKIRAIKLPVTNTKECKDQIDAAAAAYEKLTSEQKNLVSAEAKKILADAKTAYDKLAAGGEKPGDGQLTDEEREQIRTLAKQLGVSEAVAGKIRIMAQQLGVPASTLLISDDTITGLSSEKDVEGSVFSLLQARIKKVTSKQITLTWKKMKAADGYDIYASKCGKKTKCKLVKTISKNSTVKYVHKKLKKGTSYKFIVRAYKIIDGKKITIAASKTVHSYTEGGKKGNSKAVKVNKTKVSLKKGKTFKIKAKEIRKNKPLGKHRAVCYESSNTGVAAVTKKGVIKAQAKGSATIYVYAQNGLYKKIKVTVK